VITSQVAKNVGGRPAKPKDKERTIELIPAAKPPQKIADVSKPKESRETAHKAAELFNTNRTPGALMPGGWMGCWNSPPGI
jgi:hypothetical protein